MMKFVSIFVNDSAVAWQVLKSLPSKGKIYHSFRYDAEIPDLFASDGAEYSKRKKVFESSLKGISLMESSAAIQALTNALDIHEQSGEAINAKDLFGKFALEVMCSEVFGVDLAVMDPSNHKTEEVLKALATMTDAQVSTGIYVLPDIRKVSAEELQTAKGVWKEFLAKLLETMKAKYAKIQTQGHVSDMNFGASIISLLESNQEYHDKEAVSDIHQLLKHGTDYVAGALSWMCYSLHKHPKVYLLYEFFRHCSTRLISRRALLML
jgi:cytochrome P450